MKLLSIYIFLDSNTFAVKAYAEFIPFFGQRMGFVRKSQLKIRILWTPQGVKTYCRSASIQPLVFLFLEMKVTSNHRCGR